MKLRSAVILSLSVASSTLLSGCSIFAIGEEEFACPGRDKGVLCKGPREVYQMTNTQEEILMGGLDDDGNYVSPDRIEGADAHAHDDAWLISNFSQIEDAAVDDPDDDTIMLYKAAVRAKMRMSSPNNDDGINTQTVYKPRTNNRQHPDSYDQANVVADQVNGTPSNDIANQGEIGALSLFSTAPHDIAPEPLALLKPAEVLRILVVAYQDDNKDLHMPGYVYVDLQPRSWIIGEQANTTPQRIIPLDIRKKTQKQAFEEQRRKQGVTGLGVGQLPQMPHAGQNVFSANKADGSQ